MSTAPKMDAELEVMMDDMLDSELEAEAGWARRRRPEPTPPASCAEVTASLAAIVDKLDVIVERLDALIERVS